MSKNNRNTRATSSCLLVAWPQIRDRILSSQYLRYNVLLLSTNILAGIFAYLLHPMLGHMMGVSEYGQVAALIALSVVLTTPTQIIATVTAKYAASLPIGDSSAQLNDLIRRLTPILLAAGLGITAVFVATRGYVTSFFHLNSDEGVVLLGLIFIVSFATPLNLGILQGQQRFGWYATVTLLSLFLRLVLSIGFVFIGLGVNGAILGVVASALLAYLVSFHPLKNFLRGPRADIGSLRPLWTYALLAAATATGIVVLYSIDTVLAKHFLSANEAGLYAALATIGRTVLFITSSVATVMFPRVIALYERGEPHTHVAVQAMLSVLILSTLVEAVFSLAPSFMIRVLFGQAFVAIAGQLATYGMAMLLLAIAQVVMTYLLAIGNRPFVLVIFLACGVQAVLIVWRHADIAQLVDAVLVTNAALVLILLIIFAVTAHKASTGISASLRTHRIGLAGTPFSEEGGPLFGATQRYHLRRRKHGRGRRAAPSWRGWRRAPRP